MKALSLVAKKAKFTITQDVLAFYLNNQCIHQENLAQFLQISLRRPWLLQEPVWQITANQKIAETLQLTCQTAEIAAKLIFSFVDETLQVATTFTSLPAAGVEDFAVGVQLNMTAGTKHKVTLPHILYNDNPSADPDRIIPHIGEVVGKGTIVEEHRLPIPGINIEWQVAPSTFYSFTLLAQPAVKTGNVLDYWSLGALRAVEGEALLLMSGPLMFNGTKDVVYGGRNTPLSYQLGYRDLKQGETLKKTFYLEWQTVEEGRGFRSLVAMGLAQLKPTTTPLHSMQEIIDYKQNVLDSRFYQQGAASGYLTFGAANEFGNISGRPDYFLYGWTGQNLKLAWCDCYQGILKDNQAQFLRGKGVADFFAENGETPVAGLFNGYYTLKENSWRGFHNNPEAELSSRIEGEAISDLLDLMTLFKENNLVVPQAWEAAVKRACTFLMAPSATTEAGIYPLAWELDGSVKNQQLNTAGMPCVIALIKAANYFSEPAYLDVAKEKCAVYYDLHMKTFERPFAHATMDAACEDKEAGLYVFEALVELYKATGEELYQKWASLAGDWILTFVFFWETGFQKGTACAEKGFKTTGWPGVSVQNHHLDVFFPSYTMYEFGLLTQQERFVTMGQNVYNALTYGISTYPGEWGYSVLGEQGEQYYNTNYFQVRYPLILEHMDNWRGGMQRWNPSWITAQVMSNALKFQQQTKLS